jgi:hypothetical protein
MMIKPWGVVLLALLGVVSVLLAVGSSIAWRNANARHDEAVQVIERADSLVKDWTARGCAPRTQSVQD